MALTVRINYRAEVDEWIQRHPAFKFLKEIEVPNNQKHLWNTNDSHWDYVDKPTYGLQVMFIGKTGYGKSTTLNKLVGKTVFETSDISACTKNLYNSMYRIDKKKASFFVVSDLPGVGESSYADNNYCAWYREMLDYSEVVIYLLRADQRDFAIDQMMFNNLFKTEYERSKVIIALNCADKIEPVSRNRELSKAQLVSLENKKQEVAKFFEFPLEDIIYYSATDGTNLEKLSEKIAEKIKAILKITAYRDICYVEEIPIASVERALDACGFGITFRDEDKCEIEKLVDEGTMVEENTTIAKLTHYHDNRFISIPLVSQSAGKVFFLPLEAKQIRVGSIFAVIGLASDDKVSINKWVSEKRLNK